MYGEDVAFSVTLTDRPLGTLPTNTAIPLSLSQVVKQNNSLIIRNAEWYGRGEMRCVGRVRGGWKAEVGRAGERGGKQLRRGRR